VKERALYGLGTSL